MKRIKFEEKLMQMKKPEVPELKHQEMLAEAITRVKGKNAMSWWWIFIPLYVIAALIMKSLFMPGRNLISSLREMAIRDKYLLLLLFILIPIVLLVVNILSISEIYYHSGNPKGTSFWRSVWINLAIIIIAVLIIIIFLI